MSTFKRELVLRDLDNNHPTSNGSKGKALENSPSIDSTIMPKSTENVKEKYCVALDRECKRISVMYPFLSKSQIRNRARQVLSNQEQAPVSRRTATVGKKGKAALRFVTNENSKNTGTNSLYQESKESPSKMQDEDSDDQEFISTSKTSRRLSSTKDADPTYYPTAKERVAKNKSKNQKNGSNDAPKPNGNNRKLAKKGTKCDFMELGGNCFADDEELEPFKVSNLSKSTLFSKNAPCKNQIITAAVKSKKVTDSAEDDMFDIWMMDDNRSGSESPGSNHSGHLLNSPLYLSPILDSTDRPTFRESAILDKVAVDSNAKPVERQQEKNGIIRNSAEKNNNASENRFQFQDGIFNKSTNQLQKTSNTNRDSELNRSNSRIQNISYNPAKSQTQPKKQFQKSTFEDGIEVVTLSSDSEDDDIIQATARPTKEGYFQFQMKSISDIKIEKSTPKRDILPPLKRPPEVVPRGILKPAPRISQMPNFPRPFGVPKQWRNISTQMTPPRSINVLKPRPQMQDRATETEVELDESEDSSLENLSESPCIFQTRLTNWMEKLQNATPRPKQSANGFPQGTAPAIQTINRFPKAIAPKFNSIQTQTDSLNFQEPGASAFEKPKRFVSWQDDQLGKLGMNNEKTKHNGFLHSFGLDFESENSIGGGDRISTNSTSTQTINPNEEIRMDKYVESDFDAEDEKLANAWFYVFNSPIKPLVTAGMSTERASLDVKKGSELSSSEAPRKPDKPEELPVLSPEDQQSDETISSLSSSEEVLRADDESVEMELELSPLTDSSDSQSTLAEPAKDFSSSEAIQENATTESVQEPSLLETWLVKMRTFGPNLGIKTEVLSTPSRLDSRGAIIHSNYELLEPQTKKQKLQDGRDRLCGKGAVRTLNNQVLSTLTQNTPSKVPKTPQNGFRGIFEDPLLSVDLLKKKPVPVKRAAPNPATGQIAPKVKVHSSYSTPKKGDLLCDLFEVATPKSAGGTINRFLSYSNLRNMQGIQLDEDCSSFFG